MKKLLLLSISLVSSAIGFLQAPAKPREEIDRENAFYLTEDFKRLLSSKQLGPFPENSSDFFKLFYILLEKETLEEKDLLLLATLVPESFGEISLLAATLGRLSFQMPNAQIFINYDSKIKNQTFINVKKMAIFTFLEAVFDQKNITKVIFNENCSHQEFYDAATFPETSEKVLKKEKEVCTYLKSLKRKTFELIKPFKIKKDNSEYLKRGGKGNCDKLMKKEKEVYEALKAIEALMLEEFLKNFNIPDSLKSKVIRKPEDLTPREIKKIAAGGLLYELSHQEN